jgi:hypothetical protein
MGFLKFAFISVAMFGIVGPLLPTLLLTSPSQLMDPVGVALVAFLFAPTAYLLGGLIAVFCGAAFSALVLVVVVRLGPRRFRVRSSSLVLGGAAGTIVALPWVAFVPNLTGLILFLVPSVFCGAVLGLFALPRLVANQSPSKNSQRLDAG